MPPSIDLIALGTWMDRADLPGHDAPTATYVSGGSQNEIYDVRRGDARYALRIPPLSAPTARDDGIRREWRILDALRDTDVPHPPAVALCDDASVLGRPFYLMGFVDGWSPIAGERTWPEPFASDVAARAGLAFELIDGIARLSQVDWRARGLADLGRPDGFHDRQVDRWTRFLRRIEARELPGFDEAAAWLRNHRPIDFLPGIMHGDYQFANAMFRHGAPARLAAIVDWEMGTVGDPKLDLAWVVMSWPEHPDSDSPGYIDMAGMPARTALLAAYAERSGRQLDDIDYYVILARWKLAVVLEQGYQRASGEEKLEAFGPIVLDLFSQAAELTATTDYAVTTP